MPTPSPSKKTKVTFDCSLEEKTYIKMLAAKSNLTLGELVISYLKVDFPKKSRKQPNKKTIAAHEEALKGKGTSYKTIDEFWSDLGVSPYADD